MVEGGGWNSTPRLLRVGFRTSSFRVNAADNLGFRVARTLDPSPDAGTDTDASPDTGP